MLLLEEYETKYTYDHIPGPMPSIDHIFSNREYSHRLYIRVGGATVCCHFFKPDEIELDIHPTEIRDASQQTSILAFVRRVAIATGLPARVTPENQPNSPFFAFNPDGSVTNHGG